MARTVDNDLLKRNAKLIEDYKADPDQDITTLGRRYGVHYQNAILILRNSGVYQSRGQGRRPYKAFSDGTTTSRAISPLHQAIGLRLDNFLNRKLKEDTNATATKVALELNTTAKHLTRMRSGGVEFTLSELISIAAVMEVSLTTLIQDEEGKSKKLCQNITSPSPTLKPTGSFAGSSGEELPASA